MSQRPANSLLVVMAKEPLAGIVKTRLSPPLSPSEAADLYRCFLRDRLREMAGLEGVDVAIAFAPEGGREDLAKLAAESLRRPFRLFAQEGEDLGARLHRIFEENLSGSYGAVSIIDSDSPDLPFSVVEDSLRHLADDEADLVLGPCEDGGYYLVGLTRPCADLFTAVPWSTSSVLAVTLERAAARGIRTTLLPPWRDLDTYHDLMDFLHRYGKAGAERMVAPRTLAWILRYRERM